MTRTRAADDFATIRARMEELRREREQASKNEAKAVQSGSRGMLRKLEGRPRLEPEGPPPRRYGSGR